MRQCRSKFERLERESEYRKERVMKREEKDDHAIYAHSREVRREVAGGF